MSLRRPEWDHDAKIGWIGEGIVNDIRAAFADGTVETKNDQRATSTGNLYIEYESFMRSTGGYERSGLSTTRAAVWCFIISDAPPIGLFLATESLRTLARRAWVDGRFLECREGSNPTRGVGVPLTWVVGRNTGLRRAA